MFHLHHHDRIDSTSAEAARRVRARTARHGEVHVAREQTHGRGRQGRVWHSEPGAGLFATLVWFVDGRPSGAAATMAAGLAVLTTVHAAGVERARLDWPNDCEVDGAKLAGVLIEALDVGESHSPRTALLVGVGINVTQRDFPPELRNERAVTSLALAGARREADPVGAALARLLPALAQELERVARGATDLETARALAADFAAATGLVGREVCVRCADRDGERELMGTFEGLDLAHGLSLTVDGERRNLPLEHVRAVEPRSTR